MLSDNLLRKYAKLAVKAGVNVQKGQPLVISASVYDAKFVEYCVEEAYKLGAKEVSVKWNDEIISHHNYEYQDIDTLCEIPDWIEQRVIHEQDNKSCYLYIGSYTPGFMADIDPEKMKKSSIAYMEKMHKYQNYTMSNKGQWCGIAMPNLGWAKKVFPDKSDEEALELLTDAILKAVHVDEDNDPIDEWNKLNEQLMKHCNILNEYNFKTLHFTNSLGTDLYVDLVKDHIWVGGGAYTPEKVFFNPNMPTEECFCMPDKDNVNGVVYASKPLSYSGRVIEDFWFKFENGKVIDYGAKTHNEALTELFETDEGAKHLGEVALISYDSPISNMNILFYNTLFDENASCHLAFGACYPENIKGGVDMDEDEIFKLGGNKSMEHVDFMFGTSDLKVVGIKYDGTEIEIFKDGNFII